MDSRSAPDKGPLDLVEGNPILAFMDAPGGRTLADVRIGDTVVIARAHRVEARQRRRLAELGLRPGAAVRVLMRTAGGGRVIAVDHARVVVSREILPQLTVVDAHTTDRQHPASPADPQRS